MDPQVGPGTAEKKHLNYKFAVKCKQWNNKHNQFFLQFAFCYINAKMNITNNIQLSPFFMMCIHLPISRVTEISLG